MLRKTNSSSSSAESLLWSSVLLWLCVIRCWSALSWCALLLLLNRSAGRSLPVQTQQIFFFFWICCWIRSSLRLPVVDDGAFFFFFFLFWWINERTSEWMNEQGEHKIRSTVWPRYRYGWNTVRQQRPLSSSLALASRLFVIVYLCTSIHELFIILIKLNPSSSSSSKPFSLLHWRGWSVLSDQETNRFRREIEREEKREQELERAREASSPSSPSSPSSRVGGGMARFVTEAVFNV